MIPSASCKNMIKGFEGYRDTAYKCVPTEKHWTIGYGHYGPDVQPGQKITREQGDAYFEADIAWCIAAVNKLSLPFQLNQNQFDALVSFAYNLGPKRLQDFRGKSASVIAAEIPLYCHCGKKVLPGLVRRRNAERDLFLSDPSLAELNRSISSVADEVIQGKWGNGAERKQRLTEAGYNYDEVQAEVNRKLKPPPPLPPKKSVSELADEVIQGRWGCGAERKRRLAEAGYDYSAVQAEVNRRLRRK